MYRIKITQLINVLKMLVLLQSIVKKQD